MHIGFSPCCFFYLTTLLCLTSRRFFCSAVTIAAFDLTSPATLKNETESCVDSYGNILRPSGTKSSQYFLVDVLGQQDVLLHCKPSGSRFDLEKCRCISSNNFAKACQLYINFDDEVEDLSANAFPVHAQGDCRLDQDVFARGSGSVYLNNGARLRISGLQSTLPNLQQTATWCLFYRCPSMATTTSHRQKCHGGLLSNRHLNGDESDVPKSEFSLTIALDSQGSLDVNFGLANGDIITFHGIKRDSEEDTKFSSVCSTFNDTHATVFLPNKDLEKSIPVNRQSTLSSSAKPYTIGYDSLFGAFNGWIDELLICDRVLNREEMRSFYQGKSAMKRAGLLANEPEKKYRSSEQQQQQQQQQQPITSAPS